ncbi:type-F conjugative transfer system pilin assembly thiol-disulfide isomerase TrbB [Vibrio europaeus]|jgi:type-F conjugative transfer system pilin assembly thiol-disulfide isomerase TrbB|uniref:type-F conjugative transfer system pilin assembly thiol-disulfide isomerase TrbB n=1 Tax=Vibrio europaeus TaxID=300876 RepID=UPI0006AA0599|nr:type-F conjugative transfer system pilin assembly thiol-disulfide isomerase TrbB [Vibrio europaeus]KOO13736.1 conjugal transfer protein TrbB [Vibrio xuii]MDC5842222.1 type-F conjugative transfer system pilin assembly thiol-disulfide isomerase TrbB [Vibrio europaeus]
MLKRSLILLLFVIGLFPAHASMQNQYAMVFFYRSDCPHCHNFAPKFKAFAEQKQLQTYVFSLDNKPLQDYPVPIPATPEIAQQFFEEPRNITVPATFLINVNSRKFVKVSIGDVSYSELAQSVEGILSDQNVLKAIE